MPQAAARATTLASALQEKARLYSGPGSFLQRNATWLSQQASADTDTNADTAVRSRKTHPIRPTKNPIFSPRPQASAAVNEVDGALERGGRLAVYPNPHPNLHPNPHPNSHPNPHPNLLRWMARRWRVAARSLAATTLHSDRAAARLTVRVRYLGSSVEVKMMVHVWWHVAWRIRGWVRCTVSV